MTGTSRRLLTTGGFVPKGVTNRFGQSQLKLFAFHREEHCSYASFPRFSSALLNVDRVRSQSLFSIAHTATILDYLRLCGAPGEHPTGTVTLCASQLGVWYGFYQSILTRPQSSRSDISFGYCTGVVLSSLQWPQEQPPLLLRLQKQGSIDSEWGTSENNRKARFYYYQAGTKATCSRDGKLGVNFRRDRSHFAFGGG